jgi:hypothetical protein
VKVDLTKDSSELFAIASFAARAGCKAAEAKAVAIRAIAPQR